MDLKLYLDVVVDVRTVVLYTKLKNGGVCLSPFSSYRLTCKCFACIFVVMVSALVFQSSSNNTGCLCVTETGLSEIEVTDLYNER